MIPAEIQTSVCFLRSTLAFLIIIIEFTSARFMQIADIQLEFVFMVRSSVYFLRKKKLQTTKLYEPSISN